MKTEPERWEYKMIALDIKRDGDSFLTADGTNCMLYHTGELNRLGMEGWELICFSDGYTIAPRLIFKRRLP